MTTYPRPRTLLVLVLQIVIVAMTVASFFTAELEAAFFTVAQLLVLTSATGSALLLAFMINRPTAADEDVSE